MGVSYDIHTVNPTFAEDSEGWPFISVVLGSFSGFGLMGLVLVDSFFYMGFCDVLEIRA